jgi:hypothetical protein
VRVWQEKRGRYIRMTSSLMFHRIKDKNICDNRRMPLACIKRLEFVTVAIHTINTDIGQHIRRSCKLVTV